MSSKFVHCCGRQSRSRSGSSSNSLDQVVDIPVVAQMQIPLVRLPKRFSSCSTLIRCSTFAVQVVACPLCASTDAVVDDVAQFIDCCGRPCDHTATLSCDNGSATYSVHRRKLVDIPACNSDRYSALRICGFGGGEGFFRGFSVFFAPLWVVPESSASFRSSRRRRVLRCRGLLHN